MSIAISLAMIVKDEEARIADCLDPIASLFDDIVIVDTGSSDATCHILRERYGITPLEGALDARNCDSKSPARNLGFARCRHPWIIRLDADERLSATDIQVLSALEPPSELGGYFVAWNTYRDEFVTRDYKLLLFRNGIRTCGVVHENMQIDIRDQGLDALWLDDIELAHYPDTEKDQRKAQWYRERLVCGLTRDPTCTRYQWFLGYACYRDGEFTQALTHLRRGAESHSRRFPVECLNAHMVLAAIHARQGKSAALRRTLDEMAAFLDLVRDDFEVRINRHLGPWIDSARAALTAGRLQDVVPRSFAT